MFSQISACLPNGSFAFFEGDPAVSSFHLGMLRLEGAVVTADAMHGQKAIAEKIIERGADYILQVKDNQPKLMQAIADEFDRHGETSYSDRRVRQHTKSETNRGRTETRTCLVAPAQAALKRAWTGLRAIGLILRTRGLSDGTLCDGMSHAATESAELSYFISSLPPKVREHAWHLRKHWRVENTLHHTLDVTFAEDASRIRKGSGSEITSVFRRKALSILKSDTTINDKICGKRLTAGWNLNKLKEILLAFQSA